jgi:hypothetical protein
MKTRLSRVRARLSFANVTSTLALFAALGGTSYAAARLPSNSVGKSQIRSSAVGKSEAARNSIGSSELRGSSVTAPDIKTNAVGPSEVRVNAIDSDEIAAGGINSGDLADAAKAELTGAKAVTFRVASTSTGTPAGGTGKSVVRTAAGQYTVDLGTDVSTCQFSATVGGVKTGNVIEQPPVAFATAGPGAATSAVSVRTYAVPGGAAVDAPFHLLVAC